jgi:hypothetical protein
VIAGTSMHGSGASAGSNTKNGQRAADREDNEPHKEVCIVQSRRECAGLGQKLLCECML